MKKSIVLTVLAAAVISSVPSLAVDVINPLSLPAKIDLNAYKDKAIEIVRLGLNDENPQIKMNAIEVVANTKSKELLPLVLNMTKSTSIMTRFAAAVALGDANYSPATYSLKELLKDTDENVRMAAAYSLIKMGDTESGLEAYILKGFIASTDQTVKANAAMLLGKLGDKRALPPLWKSFNSGSSNDRFRIQAVESIAMLKDEQIYNKIWGMLISKFVDDRIMGIRAMSALGTLDAQHSIATMLDDSIDDVKLCAACELGKFRDKAGEREVLDFLSRNSDRISSLEQTPASHMAIMAVGTIKSPRLNVYLPKLLENSQKDLQLAAAQSLLMNVR